MTIRADVDLPHPPEAVRAYFRDPGNRPQWQSSLRRVEDVRGAGEVGSTWTDVTKPGLRPRMRVTEDTPARWAETGTWRGWVADLALEFAPHPGGTRVHVVADLVPPARLGPLRGPARRVLEALARRAVAADVRRAAPHVGD